LQKKIKRDKEIERREREFKFLESEREKGGKL